MFASASAVPGPCAAPRPCVRVLWLLVALAALIVTLGGCQLDPNAVKQDPFLQELVAAQQANATPKLGQAFTVGNTEWTITSTEAAYQLKLGTTQLQARGMYIVVHFRFTNRMTTPQHAPADILALQSGNKTFTAASAETVAYAAWTHATNLLTVTLKPDVAYTAAFVFDVPRNAGGLTLQVHSLPDPNQPDFSI